MNALTIKLAETSNEIEQILSLQEENLLRNISLDDKEANGFVTVKHDFNLLKKMNVAAPQIIAKDGERVVGYALVMPREFSAFVPVLVPMFEMFGELYYQGKTLTDYSYYVMGQICIADTYRGKGLFEQLYAKHKEAYSKKYELCLTEVSSSNPRSMRAHEKIGFQTIHNFDDQTDNWNILLWDWR
jgi:ribosomal protein S18 acetylase RimI-like enzyme